MAETTKSQKLNVINENTTASSIFDEGNVGEWILQNKHNLLYALLVMIALLALGYKLTGSSIRSSEADYIRATNNFLAFVNPNISNDPQAAEEALNSLEISLQQHPQLGASFDGSIAQTLINRNQLEKALPFASSTLERTKSAHLPNYAEYAKTTILIAENKYKEALESAFALQKSMIQALKEAPEATHYFGDELFALNLLRIAILQQQLGDTAGELKTWQYWKQYAGLSSTQQPSIKIDPQAFRTVIQQLAIGSFSLPDYIAYRENLLKKA